MTVPDTMRTSTLVRASNAADEDLAAWVIAHADVGHLAPLPIGDEFLRLIGIRRSSAEEFQAQYQTEMVYFCDRLPGESGEVFIARAQPLLLAQLQALSVGALIAIWMLESDWQLIEQHARQAGGDWLTYGIGQAVE